MKDMVPLPFIPDTPGLAGSIAYPVFPDAIPGVEIREGRYVARFARFPEELNAVLKLRFQVFNLELGEGLESSFVTQRDEDEFDAVCHHLLVQDSISGEIVGTYRLQTLEMASAAFGFYSAREFDFSSFPPAVLTSGVELGRACISRSERNTQVLLLLWKGIAAYVAHNRKQFLFGCCSLTSQDPLEGQALYHLIRREGYLHARFFIPVQPAFQCDAESGDGCPLPDVAVPRLFRTYLRFGAKVCSPPACDRKFKTIDFLVIFDVYELDRKKHSLFFSF